ncbi:MAG: putative glycoside hydrolase [Eubacteriales bacterium]|nr:putative glycoside hydrolase [Eubacteriales bacterium]
MKNGIRLAIYILIIAIILTDCNSGSVQTQGNPENLKLVDSLEMDFNKLSEEQKAERTIAREQLESNRKADMGEFYVQLQGLGSETEEEAVKAKALYLTANVAGYDFNEEDVEYYAEYIRALSGESDKPADTSRMSEINKLEKALGICEATEINALVIDIKNDSGVVAWSSDIEIVNRIGASASAPINDYDKLINYLKKKNIYRIARIVAFKDPYFAEHESSHAIQLKSGGIYKDYSGKMWVNPFDEYVWKYLAAISKEAALRGFQEIQYDYVRFPDGAKTYNPITEFPGRNGRDKDEGIEDFLKFAKSELQPYNVHISADVFGIITHSWDDKPEDIGQTWRKIANQVEYICPMIYPSHYGMGLYDFKVPDQHPYEIIRLSLMEAIERNVAQKDSGIIRPWIQGFTAPWVKGHIEYDAKAIADQLIACMELGIDEYIIWNASNNYNPMAFFYHDRINSSIRAGEEDLLSRTPEAALLRYLDAERNRRYSVQYLLTPIAEREEDYDEFAARGAANTSVLKRYEITGINKSEDGSYSAAVNTEYTVSTGAAIKSNAVYNIILEKEIYKVRKPESK